MAGWRTFAACHKLTGMALSSVLRYLGVALVCFAGAFFLIGAARTAGHTSPRKGSNQDTQMLRARLVRRADWSCGVGVLAVALAAFVTSVIGTGPVFTQPSGNMAGAVVLIATLTAIVLGVVLLTRYLILSRALRDFDNSPAGRRPGI